MTLRLQCKHDNNKNTLPNGECKDLRVTRRTDVVVDYVHLHTGRRRVTRSNVKKKTHQIVCFERGGHYRSKHSENQGLIANSSTVRFEYRTPR